jgi:hypothetical protein
MRYKFLFTFVLLAPLHYTVAEQQVVDNLLNE